MKILRIASLTILAVLLAASTFVWAQDDKHQENAPKQEDAKPAQQDEAKPANQQNDQMKQNDAKPSKDEKQEQKQQEKQDKQMRQHDQRSADQGAPANQPEKQEATPDRQQQPMHGDQQPGHPAAAQGSNGQGRGGHIPDNQFHAHFGRSHSFRAQGVIVSGQSQFVYNSYTFELVDAWPADWAYTDECYIDYIDGEYFLFDLLHPGIRIAVFVVL